MSDSTIQSQVFPVTANKKNGNRPWDSGAADHGCHWDILELNFVGNHGKGETCRHCHVQSIARVAPRWIAVNGRESNDLPSLQQSWKFTGGLWKTIFLLGNLFVHFHDCWKEGTFRQDVSPAVCHKFGRESGV